MVTEVTDSSFDKEVVKSAKPVVLDASASWCGPCQVMKPIFEQLSEEMKDAKFCSFDVDENPKISQQFGIRSIPTFLVLSKGKVLGAFMGGMSKTELKNKIKGFL